MTSVRKVRNVAYTLLSIAVVGTGIWFFIESHAAARAQELLSTERLSLSSQQLTVQRLQKQLASLRSASYDKKRIPKSADQSGILRELHQLAQATDVTITSSGFSDSSQAKKTVTGAGGANQSSVPTTSNGIGISKGTVVQATLQISGPSSHLLAFVNQLQQNQRLVVVDSFSFSFDAQPNTLSLTLEFPYQPS